MTNNNEEKTLGIPRGMSYFEHYPFWYGFFNALGINLTSIVSRPIEGRDFEFRFFFDFDTSIYAEEFANLMQTLDGCCEVFHYLGSYREII